MPRSKLTTSVASLASLVLIGAGIGAVTTGQANADSE